jgi:hypothetical protein
MRIVFLLFVTLFFASQSRAQSTSEFKEGQAVNIEGVEFLYTLGVEAPKTIDGNAYSYFTLDWYITNKGKFSKIFLLEKDRKVEHPEYDLSQKAFLGKIHVVNGLQLQDTKKFDLISVEPNTEIVSFAKRLIGNKKNLQEGFNLQSGQTLTSSITVAVPKGQRPIVSLLPFISPFY